MLLVQKYKKTWNPVILFTFWNPFHYVSSISFVSRAWVIYFPKWWCFFNPYKHIICYWITHLEWNAWSWRKWFYIGLADISGSEVLTSRDLFSFYHNFSIFNCLWFVLIAQRGSCSCGRTSHFIVLRCWVRSPLNECPSFHCLPRDMFCFLSFFWLNINIYMPFFFFFFSVRGWYVGQIDLESYKLHYFPRNNIAAHQRRRTKDIAVFGVDGACLLLFPCPDSEKEWLRV